MTPYLARPWMGYSERAVARVATACQEPVTCYPDSSLGHLQGPLQGSYVGLQARCKQDAIKMQVG
jgi:hypothetical protein